jgi:2-methylisocitrate lyase-like PEP mutase family enzyme
MPPYFPGAAQFTLTILDKTYLVAHCFHFGGGKLMDVIKLQAKAEMFAALHEGSEILVLPNCWDAGSAKILADVGFPAIATTSAGIAFSHGHADGHIISREDMCAEISRCAAIVSIPLSADMEGGYGATPNDVAETVRQAIAAGAVGANIEDSIVANAKPMLDATLATERIQAGREAADAAGMSFVLNARTDVYLHNEGAPSAAMFDMAVSRANTYYAAGARCVFVPGVTDADLIERLADAIEAPLNILAGPASPSTAELQAMGVARVSIGGSLARACLTLVENAAAELRNIGTYSYAKDTFSNAVLNRRFAPP